MAKNITYEDLGNLMVEVVIPVTKKYKIVLNVKDAWYGGVSGLYPPCMEIMCVDKCVTDVFIKRNANQVIHPTVENLKTAIDLIEEIEYRSKEGKDVKSE
jgi:hypothetical protein